MKQIKPKGEWVTRSSIPNRSERLKAHKEFEASELKKMLDNDWKIKSARVKRPRIQKQPNPRYVVTIVLGREVKVTIEDFNEHYDGFTKVKEIY